MSNALCTYFALLVLLVGNLTAHPILAVIGPDVQPTTVISPSVKPFEPFTGRITRNRVRIRTGADLNSPIVRELDHSALVTVISEDNHFYVIKPPKDVLGYVYRNYISDGLVDATNVNVRLEPSLDGVVLTQLNKGDHIEGKISPHNTRWLEIVLPTSVRFYIAKDFVEKIGPPDLLQRLHVRREEASNLTNGAFVAGQVELQKPLDQVNLEQPLSDLQRVIQNYSDLPDEVSHAQHVMATLQEAYKQKKLGLLGPRAPEGLQATPMEHEVVTQVQHETAEKEVGQRGSVAMSSWMPQEVQLFEQWQTTHPEQTIDDFYAEQRSEAVQLRGLLQPYTRLVKNKPGNFLLINHLDNQPIAFLYSTQVDLQQKVGQIVSIVALSRPNHHFAFPAFFVISAE